MVTCIVGPLWGVWWLPQIPEKCVAEGHFTSAACSSATSGRIHTLLQVVRVFREGIDFPPQPSRVLADGQVIALHTVGIDRLANRRGVQRRFHLFPRAIDDASSDLDHPSP